MMSVLSRMSFIRGEPNIISKYLSPAHVQALRPLKL